MDTLSDVNNCGGCGNVCLALQNCSAGSCACPEGTTDCGTACINLMSDGANCGGCNNACAPGQPCANGQCSLQGCPATLTQCANADGTASCVDTNVELAHCGGCNQACSAGQSCVDGSCTCPAGQAACGGQCVNVVDNVAHCGGCNQACLAGQSCVEGTCTCPAGQQACGGQCVDTSSSAVHCGDCDIQCRSGATCDAGTCVGGDPIQTGANFDVTLNLSESIKTVVIAEWSVDVPIDRAVIHFGREEGAWEYSADVDLTQPSYRTLLLGMKMNTLYYVQVEAFSESTSYVSTVESIQTDYLPNGLPTQTVTDDDASALYADGGFTVMCTGYTAIGGGQSDETLAYIVDRDGDVVWAYDLAGTVGSSCSRARMSIDGRYMWIGNFGNTTADGALMRISMDGQGPSDEYSLPGRSHDFAILPNENVVYFSRDGNVAEMAPESIWELDPATNATTLLYSELTDFGELFDDRGGHTNQVNYVPDLNAIAFSMYFIDTIALIGDPRDS